MKVAIVRKEESLGLWKRYRGIIIRGRNSFLFLFEYFGGKERQGK